MDTTNESLLRRAGDQRDRKSWQEFYKLYAPLLRQFARRRGLRADDAEDVVQECMHALAKALPTFEYDRRRGKFKAYLWTLANSKISNLHRRRRPRLARSGELRALADDDAATRAAWEREWQRAHLAYCLERVATSFSRDTLAAFKAYALEGRPLSEVCTRFNMTPNRVYLAKSRVVRRLRDEMKTLVGDVD